MLTAEHGSGRDLFERVAAARERLRGQAHRTPILTSRTVNQMTGARVLFSRMKLVVEPSGALGLAALLGGAPPIAGRVGVILSGGNVDPAVMARILEGEAQGRPSPGGGK
jgi:threonine dehydratase